MKLLHTVTHHEFLLRLLDFFTLKRIGLMFMFVLLGIAAVYLGIYSASLTAPEVLDLYAPVYFS